MGDDFDVDALRDRILRLERRLERERSAREQAERIAEHGMRDLWQINRDLEVRVAERTVELEGLLATANMASAAKERFLADLGHELTSPLHAVLGLLELVDSSTLGSDDQTRIDEVRRHATTLSELLRGLVDLAGATGPPMPADITTRSASSWIDELVDGWTLAAAIRGQLLVPSVVGVDEPVALDWRRLDRIVHAVLANANQHAGPGTIEIVVTVEQASLEVCVSDSGPGVTDEVTATAFEPFVKHGDGGGVGIGLSIAHRLAVGVGGDVEMSSDGATTRVRIVIPRGR